MDSSAWIESLRRNGDMRVKLAVEGLLEAYEAQWCAPVRLEVLGGARLEERALLGKRFSVIPYRPCREDDWDRAIALAWRIREQGLTVPWLDVLIAAIASTPSPPCTSRDMAVAVQIYLSVDRIRILVFIIPVRDA